MIPLEKARITVDIEDAYASRQSSTARICTLWTSRLKDLLLLILLSYYISSLTSENFLLQQIREHQRASGSERDPLHLNPCFPETASNKNTTHWKCGYLDVPLDHTNSSDLRTARLAVVMYQASKKKSKRTIVINPGGPGASGTSYVWRIGEMISKNYTDHTYDVLGFDPRGVNMSTPHYSCYQHDAYRDRWSLITHHARETTKEPKEHLRLQTSYHEAMWESCSAQFGDIARYLSTAFVARDLDAIRAALKEEELTAYLVSYGTAIGSTYAQMFPDRVGRVLLDGCIFIPDKRRLYESGFNALDNITDAFTDGFLGECVRSGPNGCALADKNGSTTVDGIQKRVESVLDRLLIAPMPVAHPRMGPSLLRYEAVLDLIYPSLYDAASWPRLARAIRQLERGNGTLALEMVHWSYDAASKDREGELSRTKGWKGVEVPNTSTDEMTLAVLCSDSYDDDRYDLDWWADLQDKMTSRSWIGGNSRFDDVFPCWTFKTKPAEIYRGSLNHSLRNPLLLIGETYDPTTPLQSAKRLHAAMGNDNARLTIHHGYGHSSRDRSECTEKIKRDMFLYGQWPTDTVDCFADTKPFPHEDEETSEQRFGALEWKQVRSAAARY